jgi:hypothetical protein
MNRLLRFLGICAFLSSIGNCGTITYLSRDAWLLGAGTLGPLGTEDFSDPSGVSPSLQFGLAAITSSGRSSFSSDTHPTVKHVDTSFVDVFPDPDGGNFIGTVGRTALSTSTVTTTNSEWCKAGTCAETGEQQATVWSDFSEVRSLDIDFKYPTLSFGFDYFATISGSSPNRTDHAFRMILTFIDGTTSSLWIGGAMDFSPFQEGFMGVTADLDIVSVTLKAPDRSLGSTFTSTGGDWTYQQTKPKKGDFYTYSLSETTSSDQSSTLQIGNLTTITPEPGQAANFILGGILIGGVYWSRKVQLRRRTNGTAC